MNKTAPDRNLKRYRRLLKRLATAVRSGTNGNENTYHIEKDLMNHLALLESDMKRTITDLEDLLDRKTTEVVTLETLIREQNELLQARRMELQQKRTKELRPLNSGQDEKISLVIQIQELTSQVRAKELELQQLVMLKSDALPPHTTESSRTHR
jgi:chromosome segregation ATPase